ncbi:hypothetical protein J2741_001482 [Methanolinea mesophila]|uniref:BREX-4 system phosphatase PglZ n=1 Tax=Methanolinea mesophila TaxID=547055 RepID=UPI001AEAAB1E|nr:BREX-4 system phosphatase PglZ [Methanolinea mesophila]MBP1928935.1 hypothetical protein [Methanolinea mesophila]
MNKKLLIEIESSKQLIKVLTAKYSEKKPQYLSSVRFPSSIIFFNSKKEYKEFLEQAPWDRSLLTSIIDESDDLSCYKIQTWFNNALKASKRDPLMILPITEYIRICNINERNRKISDFIFLSLVQSESSKLIVPMLDFYSNYQAFFNQFLHKDRMAEVFSVVSSDNEDSAVEIILDKSGSIPAKNYISITSQKSWLNLWETGEIAELNNLLIQNEKIINAIEKTGISVPRIKKYLINDIKDYIAFEYKIPTSVFNINPTKEILERILSILTIKGEIKSWDSIVNRILGNPINFENLVFQLWNGETNADAVIKRWFWLNEAKSKQFDSIFFKNIIRNTDDPESLLDNIYQKGLNQEIEFINELKERRELLLQFSNPLFETDKGTLKKKFQEMEESLPPDELYDRITCVFDFERHALLKCIIGFLKDSNGLNQEKFEILQQIWPALSTYVECGLSKSDNWPLIIEDFDSFVNVYISNYILSKLIFDSPNDAILEMQKSLIDHWSDFISVLKLGKIPKISNKNIVDQFRQEEFILIDGAGYEWGMVLKKLFEMKGWKINKIQPIISELPSDTTHFPIKDYLEKINEFDQNQHKFYQYPFSIVDEIGILENIVDYIHQYYRGRDTPLWIISDHGATVFARKGKPKKYTYIKKKEHGGRYGVIDPVKKIKNESVYIEKDSTTRSYAISLNYDNLGDTTPQGEAHGGGTIEEMLCTALLCIPPEINDQYEQLYVTIEKKSYSALDEELKVKIKGNIEITIKEIELKINNGLKNSIPPRYLESKTITLPIKFLRENGLKNGKNELLLIFNKTIITFARLEFKSGSEKTGFDDAFNL